MDVNRMLFISMAVCLHKLQPTIGNSKKKKKKKKIKRKQFQLFITFSINTFHSFTSVAHAACIFHLWFIILCFAFLDFFFFELIQFDFHWFSLARNLIDLVLTQFFSCIYRVYGCMQKERKKGNFRCEFQWQ